MISSVGELGRRLYADVVRRRTRVRVVVEAQAPSSATPAFILSPYRSGTTLLRYCLDSHPQLAVPPETDYLAHFVSLLQDSASMQGLADLGYAHDDARMRLGHAARAFLDTYAQGRGVSRWCDKSPRYAEMPNGIRQLFPDAAFVILHRHPLDQIESFTRGGTYAHPALGTSATGEGLIRRAADYWATTVGHLHEFAVSHADQCVSLTYEDLCKRPGQELRRVLTRLDLPWAEATLRFYDFDHDRGRESGRIAGTRGFALSSGGWREWPEGWAESAWAVVANTARKVGYALD